MLAVAGELPADPSLWAFEVKWDGVRAITGVGPEGVTITSRGGLDLSPAFPELAGLVDALAGRRAVLDGELIAFDDAGRQRFDAIQRRLRTTGPGVIARLARERPATLAIFDLLELDGEQLTGLPWSERRATLDALDLDGDHWQVPPAHLGAGAELLAATAQQELEGIVAKRITSPYRPGARSPDWLKIKHRARQEVVIGGWTVGTGRRAASLGALQVGVHDDGRLRHVGGVGSGLREADLDELRALLADRAQEDSPFASVSRRAARASSAQISSCEVEFTGWSADGRLRHPCSRPAVGSSGQRGHPRTRGRPGASWADRDVHVPRRGEGTTPKPSSARAGCA